MSAYPYGTGDLLEKRNTYFYSEYVGLEIFPAWSAQRQAALETPGAEAAQPAARKPTDVLIAELNRTLAGADPTPEQRQQLHRLVQRFEVSKRLHGEYSDRWRPVDRADYGDLDRYLGFAELMVLARTRLGGLQYLNALLKCMDTLSALASRLGPEQRTRLDALVQQEKSLVEELADRLAIALPPHDGSVRDDG